MGRPRTFTDEEILESAARAVAKEGPLRVTLQQVGEPIGLTAPGVLQRFGSKRGLLLALADACVTDVARRFASARRAHPQDPLAALVEALAAGADTIRTAGEFSTSLGFLQLDLTDADFRTRARAYFEKVDEETTALLEAAVKRGDLRDTDLDALARLVQVTYNGALLAWAFSGEGKPAEAVRRDLWALLAAYRSGPVAKVTRAAVDRTRR